MKLEKIQMATGPQTNFIEILCNDIGCRTRKESLSLISNLVSRELRFFGDLTRIEASKVIQDLKFRKEEFKR